LIASILLKESNKFCIYDMIYLDVPFRPQHQAACYMSLVTCEYPIFYRCGLIVCGILYLIREGFKSLPIGCLKNDWSFKTLGGGFETLGGGSEFLGEDHLPKHVGVVSQPPNDHLGDQKPLPYAQTAHFCLFLVPILWGFNDLSEA
jgi:hypothetical protein